ncbi:uncharacterized protein EI90DRAFT_3119457 [Cantharellus anzutake]|uniref:uncharacterized protein n=1 Tax=Cantharellus anzutake TaxID=1750568 RepID=UPI0019068043|nr:uncharacterized protein EI90DRAFT_3119457 [Cantharellus anzutake]KAF8337096.1 hypothetical protein EI90DRAFT_3119457 [Cantharellus anzutake]
MSVKDVIILDLPADFESMTQWNGQASHDGSGGRVIIYAPDEIRIENNFDLYGDQANKKKMSKNTLAAQVAYRDKCAPGFVEYFNPEQCCEAPGCTPGPPNDYQSATDHYMEKLTRPRNANLVSLPHDDQNLEKYSPGMIKVSLKLLWNWRENIWSMRKEMGVREMTNLDGPSVVTPDQSLEQLASGMHQGYCRERCEALVEAWGWEFGLDAPETELLIEVIEDSNKRWERELEIREKGKGSRKRKALNRMVDDDNGALGEGETSSATILVRPRQVGKRSIKLTIKAANADQDVE